MKVKEILRGEAPKALPHESAASAWKRMHELGVDHLVVESEGEIMGVVSRHDLSGPSGGTHRRMGRRVAELMRRDVITTSPNADVRRAAALMRRHGVSCLPVVARGRIVGVVAASDLLALLERLLRAAHSPKYRKVRPTLHASPGKRRPIGKGSRGLRDRAEKIRGHQRMRPPPARERLPPRLAAGPPR